MCRSQAEGGRRCSAHANPLYTQAYNARRKAIRQARKNGQPIPSLAGGSLLQSQYGANGNSPAYDHIGEFSANTANTESTFYNVEEPIKVHHSKNFETVAHHDNIVRIIDKKGNVGVTYLDGDVVDDSYFDKHQWHGVLKPENIDENTARTLGFEALDKNHYDEQSEIFADTKYNEVVGHAKNEITNITSQERDYIVDYTMDSYSDINDALSGKHSLSDMPDDVQEHVKKSIKHLDKTLENNSPGFQRTVYRGIKSNSRLFQGKTSDEWVKENMSLGSEVTFPNFQSSSYHPDTAVSFSDEGNGTGVVLQIKTAQGVCIANTSDYEDELEVLLPRNARYMVVGNSKQEINDSNDPKYRVKHVIQLVAINSKGEILDGTNHDPVVPFEQK